MKMQTTGSRTGLIWDMDGTLVDSYPAIVPAVREACAESGLHFEEEYIYREVIRSSVGDFIARHAAEQDAAWIQARFDTLNDSRIDDIRPMPHAGETLAALTESGNLCFVFTHRRASCHAILEHTGLQKYFTEVVTALDGFPRKPAPDAILFLLEKYALAPESSFYVGDRSLDIEAANNAGIGSILYLPPSSPGSIAGNESFVVRDLLEIPALLGVENQKTGRTGRKLQRPGKGVSGDG